MSLPRHAVYVTQRKEYTQGPIMTAVLYVYIERTNPWWGLLMCRLTRVLSGVNDLKLASKKLHRKSAVTSPGSTKSVMKEVRSEIYNSSTVICVHYNYHYAVTFNEVTYVPLPKEHALKVVRVLSSPCLLYKFCPDRLVL